jgi:hypothetical protein
MLVWTSICQFPAMVSGAAGVLGVVGGDETGAIEDTPPQPKSAAVASRSRSALCGREFTQ